MITLHFHPSNEKFIQNYFDGLVNTLNEYIMECIDRKASRTLKMNYLANIRVENAPNIAIFKHSNSTRYSLKICNTIGMMFTPEIGMETEYCKIFGAKTNYYGDGWKNENIECITNRITNAPFYNACSNQLEIF